MFLCRILPKRYVANVCYFVCSCVKVLWDQIKIKYYMFLVHCMCNIQNKNGQQNVEANWQNTNEKMYINRQKNQLYMYTHNNEELEESFADVVDLIKSLRKIKTSRIIKGFIGFIHLIYVSYVFATIWCDVSLNINV